MQCRVGPYLDETCGGGGHTDVGVPLSKKEQEDKIGSLGPEPERKCLHTTHCVRAADSERLSRPWPVFRTRHGSRIVCMSLTLNGDMNGDMNVDMKITTEGALLRMDAAFSGGSKPISLAWGMS